MSNQQFKIGDRVEVVSLTVPTIPAIGKMPAVVGAKIASSYLGVRGRVINSFPSLFGGAVLVELDTPLDVDGEIKTLVTFFTSQVALVDDAVQAYERAMKVIQ